MTKKLLLLIGFFLCGAATSTANHMFGIELSRIQVVEIGVPIFIAGILASAYVRTT
jgi:hypothetical protein